MIVFKLLPFLQDERSVTLVCTGCVALASAFLVRAKVQESYTPASSPHLHSGLHAEVADAHVGQKAPLALTRQMQLPALLVAIECTECSVRNDLPGLDRVASQLPIYILPLNSSKIDRTTQRKYPHLRFLESVDLPSRFSPELYRIDSQGKWSYVQSHFLDSMDLAEEVRSLGK